MQTHSQQSREDEKQGHFPRFEEFKGVQTERFSQRNALLFLLNLALGQREAIGKQHQTQHARHEELHISVLEFVGVVGQRERKRSVFPHGAVHKPHRRNETNRSEHANRRKILHRVIAVVLQRRERRGVRQGDRRHKKRHAQRVHRDEKALVRQFLTKAGLHAHPPTNEHKKSRRQMAQTQQPLRLYPLVGHDAHQRRHKN